MHTSKPSSPASISPRLLVILGCAVVSLIVLWLGILHVAMSSVMADNGDDNNVDAIVATTPTSNNNKKTTNGDVVVKKHPDSSDGVVVSSTTSSSSSGGGGGEDDNDNSPAPPCTHEEMRRMKRRIAQLEAALMEVGGGGGGKTTKNNKDGTTSGQEEAGSVCSQLRKELVDTIMSERQSQKSLKECRAQLSSKGGGGGDHGVIVRKNTPPSSPPLFVQPRRRQQQQQQEQQQQVITPRPTSNNNNNMNAINNFDNNNNRMERDTTGTGHVMKGPTDPTHDPPGTMPILIFTYNRAAMVKRLVERIRALVRRPNLPPFRLFVSQDVDNMFPEVATAIQELQTRTARSLGIVHLMHTHDDSGATAQERENGWQPYLAIAHHYKWAIEKTFGMNQHYARLIILEEDLEISADFFDYMVAMAPLFDQDESLYCVSGFNDNGKAALVQESGAAYRSDFFPGLGWMLSRKLWAEELQPKWPRGFWDDWMRQPKQRKGRACIRPEISRSRPSCTDGEGASQGQFCDDHLKQIVLYADRDDENDDDQGGGRGAAAAQQQQPMKWASFNIQTLLPQTYDTALKHWLSGAKQVFNTAAIDALPSRVREVKIGYGSNEEFQVLAQAFNIMSDFKDRVPRTAYHGVVTFRWRGATAAFAAQKSGVAPRLLPSSGNVVRVHLYSEKLLYDNSAE